MRVLLHLALASFHTFQLMQKPTAAPIEEAPWQQRRLTHGKLFFFATPCTGYYGLAGLFWSQKRSSREVDLLMRKNKTGLTAHHFMSAPGDSLSDSFPIYFVCFTAEAPSKCISWSLPTCLFFFPHPSLACDRYFSTIYQPHPAQVKDGSFFFSTPERHTDGIMRTSQRPSR